MGGKWMSKNLVNEELIHIGKKMVSGLSLPPWRNINSNERKENGCLYYLLGRELAPSPSPRFENKAWNIIIF